MARIQIILLNEDSSFAHKVDVAKDMLETCSLVSYKGINYSYTGMRQGILAFRRTGPIIVIEDQD